jgi:hypothetical protein
VGAQRSVYPKGRPDSNTWTAQAPAGHNTDERSPRRGYYHRLVDDLDPVRAGIHGPVRSACGSCSQLGSGAVSTSRSRYLTPIDQCGAGIFGPWVVWRHGLLT